MNSPRVVVRYFGPGKDQVWTRLVRVLEHTARRHCHGWTLDFAPMKPDPDMSSPLGRQGTVWNTQKLNAWTDIVQQAADGDRLLLLDADTIIRRPLDDIWDEPFDFAYTVKPKDSRFPLNGGVVFLRVSERVREFMRAWREMNHLFMTQPLEFQVWSPAYGGVNQAALGALLRSRPSDMAIRKLPCLEWNCEDEHWALFDEQVTRIVHYKSELRYAVFQMMPPSDETRGLVNLWRALEKETMTKAGVRLASAAPPADVSLEHPDPPHDERPDQTTQVTTDTLLVPEETMPRPLSRAERRRQERERVA